MQIILQLFSSEIDQSHYAKELFTNMLVHNREGRISSNNVVDQLNTIKGKVINVWRFPLNNHLQILL